MPMYVYETTGEKKRRRFELRQSMNDTPLTHDPQTGEPVRRVISGGYGILQKAGGATAANAAPSQHSCGSGGCGCH
jgi:predicted nucleic acid-binding Zn ribbon protein